MKLERASYLSMKDPDEPVSRALGYRVRDVLREAFTKAFTTPGLIRTQRRREVIIFDIKGKIATTHKLNDWADVCLDDLRKCQCNGHAPFNDLPVTLDFMAPIW